MTRFTIIFTTLFVSGCHFIGPSALRQGGMDYNIAIQRTNDEQLLLNLVRLKYRDTPVFLNVTSVSTQFSFTGEASTGLVLQGGTHPRYAPGASLSYAEKPTVTYTPLHGETFAKQLLTPIPLDRISLLYHSGWRIDRILRCCVQQINGLKNAPGAASPTPDKEPEYKEFFEVAELLRALQVKDAMELGRNGLGHFVIRIGEAGKEDPPEAAKLKELLGLPNREDKTYPVNSAVGAAVEGEVTLGTRSLLGTLFYLSQGVAVPESEIEIGRITKTLRKDGSRFEWSELLNGIFEVRSNADSPAGAAVGVSYRGIWFYIDDADLTSKSTFGMLTQLLALQSGDKEFAVPQITLPVGD